MGVLKFLSSIGQKKWPTKYPIEKGFVYILFLEHRPKYKNIWYGRRETYIGATATNLNSRFGKHKYAIEHHEEYMKTHSKAKSYVSRVAKGFFVLGVKPSDDCWNEEEYFKNVLKLDDQQKKDLAKKWFKEHGKIWKYAKSRDDFGTFKKLKHMFHGV